MEFRNQTPFPALAFDALDQRDIRFHTVVMRLTFEVQDDGTLAFAPEQTPLASSDEYYGELNQSSVRQESDFAPYKPHTDVILTANACAPQAAPSTKPTKRFPVGIQITNATSAPQLPEAPRGLNPMQSASHAQMQAWREECERLKNTPPAAHVVLNKQLIVTGPRHWTKRYLLTRALSLFTLPKWKLSAPTPITTLPLRYEYAYGGENKILVTDPNAKRVKKKERLPDRAPQRSQPEANADTARPTPAIAHSAYEQNTVGRGYAQRWYLGASKVKQIAAAQIEAPNERITRFGQAMTPRGFGVIARAWQPRLQLAGTYDQAWLEQRHPYLPADFNFAYWNGAPGDQQIRPHLDGDETVTLTNLCPAGTPGSRQDQQGNTQLRFSLPGHLPFVLVRFDNGLLGELAARLDTLIIDTMPANEADANDPAKKTSVICVWRATVATEPKVRVLEARMLAKTDVEHLRAQQDAAQSRSTLFA